MSRYKWEDREAIDAELRKRISVAQALVKKASKAYQLRLEGKWRWVPGVTTVCGIVDKSDALVKWASRLQYEADARTAYRMYSGGMPKDLSETAFLNWFNVEAGQEKEHVKALRAAGDLGGQTHALVEFHVRLMLGEPVVEPQVSDEAMYAFSGWEDWAAEVEFRPVATEFPVYSLSQATSGTPDVLAWVKRELMLPDWKTSNGIYGEHYLQNTAYRRFLMEMGILEENIPGLLVRLPKDSCDPLDIHHIPVDEEDDTRWEVFKHLRGVYDWKKAEDKRGLDRWRANRDRQAAAEAGGGGSAQAA